MLSLFKRHRELLLVTTLLVYPFVTFLSQGGRGRDPNVVDRAILGITAPIQRWLLGGGEAVAEGVRSYVALRGVREENLALADEAARLRNEMNDLTELRAENQRLKQAMGYADATPETEILARVVGFSPAPSPKAVRLDRGISAGVRAGMAVVSSEGVVGQVIRATDSSADVALVTDPQTRVGVRVQRSQGPGHGGRRRRQPAAAPGERAAHRRHPGGGRPGHLRRGWRVPGGAAGGARARPLAHQPRRLPGRGHPSRGGSRKARGGPGA